MDNSKKDIHANVGFSISSSPEKTEVSKPGASPRVPKAEFPFRIIFISDLAPERIAGDWASGNQLRRVDRNRFSEVLADLKPSVTIEVENRLQLQPRRLELTFTVASIDDFKPEGIVRKVHFLSSLWNIRGLLGRVGKGELSVEDFRKELDTLGVDPGWSTQLFRALSEPEREGSRAPSRGSVESSVSGGLGAALDNILNMVDVGQSGEIGAEEDAPQISPQISPPTPADAFVAAISKGETPSARRAERIIADLEEKVGLQAETILGHKQFRALEASWRGLKFLVDRLDFRSNIILEVLPVGREQLAEALHHQILLPEHEGRVDIPASLLVFDEAFGYGSADVEVLSDIAGTAESIQTPAIVSMSPGFFGYDRPEKMADLPVIWQHLQSPEYIEWNRFRESSSAGYLAFAMPSMMLRTPYRGDSNGAKLSVHEEDTLWGSASIAAAAIIARRFSETGWPTRLTDPGDHQLEELPVWKSKKGPIPLGASYNYEKLDQLADEGFLVLSCTPGKDSISLSRTSTAIKVPTFEDERATRQARTLSKLDAQLFVSRIVHFLLQEEERLMSAGSAGEARSMLESRLWSLLGIASDQQRANYVTISVVQPQTEGEGAFLDVRVSSPPALLADELSFTARVPCCP